VNYRLTTSSAVDVIADRTAYDVRYTLKLRISNPFRVTSLRWYARFDLTGWVYERTRTLPRLHLLKRDHWA